MLLIVESVRESGRKGAEACTCLTDRRSDAGTYSLGSFSTTHVQQDSTLVAAAVGVELESAQCRAFMFVNSRSLSRNAKACATLGTGR